MSEWTGEDIIIIQKQEQKTSFSVYVLLIQIPSQGFWVNLIGLQRLSPKGEILSYASPPIWKLHPHGEIISKTYKPTFFATHLMAVLQPSRYSVFHGGNTPIQLGLS